jgi:hypothetical protein
MVAREAVAMSPSAWGARHRHGARGDHRLHPALFAAAYSYLTPVLAAVLAWLILGEPITTVVLVCGLMIAMGVYLLNQA